MGELGPDQPGEYHLHARATEEGKPIGEAELGFVVGAPLAEYDRLDLNEELLKELASRTGGRYVALVSFGQLVDALEASEQVKRIYREKELWNTPALFTVFLVLVSIEWLLRKRWQLT